MPAGRTGPGPRPGSHPMSTLARPRHNRVIAGVCAGLAKRFGLAPWTVRIIFLLSCLLPGPQFLIYLALWLLLPQEP